MARFLARPLWQRLFQLLYFSLGGAESGLRGMSGVQLLLLPGLIVAAVLAIQADWQAKQVRHTGLLLWAGGHVLAYALRLPVTYQHGRYLLPILPVWVVYGVIGWWWLGAYAWPVGRMVQWAGAMVARLTFVSMALFFLLLGGQAYAVDVAFIEGEMVAVAKWVAVNTEPEAVIATHDIGALGYFGERPLLDLAGLISPEIVAYLHDEVALSRYVQTQAASYLITAPGWTYPTLTTGATPLYTTEYEWTTTQGLNNMAVYHVLPVE